MSFLKPWPRGHQNGWCKSSAGPHWPSPGTNQTRPASRTPRCHAIVRGSVKRRRRRAFRSDGDRIWRPRELLPFNLAGARAQESQISTGVRGVREVRAGDMSCRGYSHSSRHCNMATPAKVDVYLEQVTDGGCRSLTIVTATNNLSPPPLSDAVGVTQHAPNQALGARRQPFYSHASKSLQVK